MSWRGTIDFTRVPTPGLAGDMNGVFSSSNGSTIQKINMGEPEAAGVAVGPGGDLYWTCLLPE